MNNEEGGRKGEGKKGEMRNVMTCVYIYILCLMYENIL